ncbi:MAG TPA: FAD-dependent oxidoreductase, partial [Ktedonobacteraceae bacterium]|nr:FAD-dependent oxidoreductase [Ktedonobacteraceae bacterium]
MDIRSSYVIIGNGIAGITAAEILRAYDASSTISIVADDPFPAYYRPALKDFLGGRLPEGKLWARPTSFYQEQRIRFIPGRVISVSPQQHSIQLHNGQLLPYHKLLLANGGRARTLACPGLNLAGVSTLRTVTDYQEILRHLENVQRVVVCGSGTLALESAETLHHCGYQVTHLLRGQLLWSEVLDPTASDMVLQEEQRDGIDVRLGEEIAEIIGRDDQVCGVVTTRGERIPCELVLIAIGIDPSVDFIHTSGVACDRGVRVDSAMRTSAQDIYAAGDVTETIDPFTGRTRVVGQWFPAIQQAQIAAFQMLGKQSPEISDASSRNFYNATFLYGLDFVSIGLTRSIKAPGFSELVAEPEPRSYRKVIFYKKRIVGALLLGDRSQALAFKRAIDHQVDLSPIAPHLFSKDFDLDAWLDQNRVDAPLLLLQDGSSSALSFSSPNRLSEGDAQTPEFEEADAYLVPIPHTRVPVSVDEMQLPRSKQGQVMTIGRQAGVTLAVEHGSVSRQHAEILCSQDTYFLRDKNSSNGTFVNGSPLKPGSSYQLRHYDLIRFGDVQFRFELRQRHSPASSKGGSLNSNLTGLQDSTLHTNASRFIPAAFLNALPETPTLVCVGPDLRPTSASLDYGRRYSLGREAPNDLAFVEASISRRHAELFSTPEGFYIRDLNSRYGVFVNNVKIQNTYHIKHGDRIVLGNILLYFSHPQGSALKAGTGALPPAKTRLMDNVPSSQTGKISVFQIAQMQKSVQKLVVEGVEHREAIVPLSSTRVAFEIDMCIGCNRCMDACPLPSSAQIAIADLNCATVTERITPNLAHFTQECIMCGSCVPVCPVDNHRDLLMLSLKQRLGTSWEKMPDRQRIVQAIPRGWSQELLIQHLREQAFLQDSQLLPDTYLLH